MDCTIFSIVFDDHNVHSKRLLAKYRCYKHKFLVVSEEEEEEEEEEDNAVAFWPKCI